MLSIINFFKQYKNYVTMIENFDKKDPLSVLPDELILKIFSYLNLSTLGKLCCVSKEWKRLASDDILWKKAIYKERAFGNDKWAQHFGEKVVENEDNIEEFSSLPLHDYIADCQKLKSIFPDKNTKNNLMLVRLPKTLNGEFNIIKTQKLSVQKKISIRSDRLPEELNNMSIDKSYWIQMTNFLLPNSKNQDYQEQEKMVAHLAHQFLVGYEIPKTLEAATCMLSIQCIEQNLIFTKTTNIYTRCIEKNDRGHYIVGLGYGQELSILNITHDHEAVGVAALRRDF
jgi:hypothetical protein